MNRNRKIAAWRCPGGHLWLYEHETCPDCGEPMTRTRTVAAARLVTSTVVRVNPTGKPIHLGVARSAAGATTLCIINGRFRGNGRDRVHLELRGDRYHAVAAASRTVDPEITDSRA